MAETETETRTRAETEQPPPTAEVPLEQVDSTDETPVSAGDFARATAGQLLRLASPAQAGLVMLGGLLALSGSPEALSPGASAVVVFGLVARVGLAVVIGLVVGHLLRGLAALIVTVAEVSDRLGRFEGAPAVTTSALDLKAGNLHEIRRAFREGRWAEAGDLVRSFTDAYPDDPDSSRISEELAIARSAAAEDLKARVEAAREVNDPDRVIELRDELKPLLDPEPLKALDRELARWFMNLIQRRLRSGTVRADVAVLSGRVAESLGDTQEGASLRASLPTLRRAAGLCPRCAEPYLGTASACPACVASARSGPAALPAAPDGST